MKIHIIGCSGSGKSYLADKLAEQYHLIHYDLDDLQWDNTASSYGIKMPKEKRSAMLQRILKQDNWIVEGVYYKWCRESFDAADRIYLLNLPSHIYKRRIIDRFVKRKLGLAKGKKETFRSLIDLLKWTDEYQTEDMPEIRKILEQNQAKVRVLSGEKEGSMVLRAH